MRHGTYDWPGTVARRTLEMAWRRVRATLTPDDTVVAIAEDDLERMPDPLPHDEDLAALNAHLTGMLDAAYLDWLADDARAVCACALVSQPGAGRLLGDWAAAHGFETLDAAAHIPEGTFDAGPPLVIPHLRGAFVRSPDGLSGIAALTGRIAATRRKVVVGCDSWPWAFLDQAVRLDLAFRHVQTWPAWDGAALAALARGVMRRYRPVATLRQARDGHDVWGADDDNDAPDYFRDLAEASNGEPHIALRLMGDAMRENPEIDGEGEDVDAAPDDLFVEDWEPMEIPGKYRDTGHFALHALLIHGGLSAGALIAAIPAPVPSALVPALRGADLIEEAADGRLSVTLRAYPSVRRALVAAGFPVDTL